LAHPTSLGAQCKAHRRFQLYVLLASGDLLALLVGFGIAAGLRLAPGEASQLVEVLLVLMPMYLTIAFQLGAYSIFSLDRWSWGVRRSLTALFFAALTVVAIAFAWKVGAQYSRLFFVVGAMLSVSLMIGTRFVLHRLASRLMPHGPVEVVVLTNRPDGPDDLRHRVIDTTRLGLAPDLNCPQSLDRLSRAIGGADRVVIACAADDRRRWVDALRGSGIDIEILLPEFEALGVLRIGQQAGRLTACVSRGRMSLRARTLKRAFDLLVVVWLMPLLLLALLIVPILIKLRDNGPIFFVQRRIGRGNRFFDVYKFRTMSVGSQDPAGARSTERNDARVTRIGALLRRTSIDELPQLINVLMGSMSIVGPRPHALGSTAEDELFWNIDQRYWARHAAKPGLTGLAQVRGFRGATDNRAALVNRIEADLEYLSGWTLWRDVRILAATIKVVAHPNAY
jgi:exopolysaccharide biosynthesis polyprenyl glycosylphosphotransferase